jgi:hypothetical protein
VADWEVGDTAGWKPALHLRIAKSLLRFAATCSADFQSAVSRISNPPAMSLVLRVTDWKSAIQQVWKPALHLSTMLHLLAAASFSFTLRLWRGQPIAKSSSSHEHDLAEEIANSLSR